MPPTRFVPSVHGSDSRLDSQLRSPAGQQSLKPNCTLASDPARSHSDRASCYPPSPGSVSASLHKFYDGEDGDSAPTLASGPSTCAAAQQASVLSDPYAASSRTAMLEPAHGLYGGTRARTGYSASSATLLGETRLSTPDELAHMIRRATQGARSSSLTVVWRDLAVQGSSRQAAFGGDMLSLLLSPLKLAKLTEKPPPIKNILHPSTGVLLPGETLLVLGRPGSGCTTFLKSLASYRDGYRAVTGDVRYSHFGPCDIEGPFRGEVAYLAEEDVHFPSLTVQETMDFATATRAPSKQLRSAFGVGENTRANYVATFRHALASALSLKHIYRIKVGNTVIHGVSGGEKKRLSLYEGIALTARVLLLDNPTRGLDSSTAAEVTRVLKTVAQGSNASVAAALYQAGEPIFAQFDRVCLLNDGHVIYFGPGGEAAAVYFYEMGYDRLPHQSSADFLISVTDPAVRRIRDGYEGLVPLKAIDMEAHWRMSSFGAQVSNEVDSILRCLGPLGSGESVAAGKQLAQSLHRRKARGVRHGSRFVTTWTQQLYMCTKRRWKIQIGAPVNHMVIFVAMLFQGLVYGSTIYNIPQDTRGFFARSSALFLMLLFTSFLAQTEIAVGYAQRPIVIRHRKFGMARPSADALANSLLDLVFRTPPLAVFVTTMYFLCHLGRTPQQFLITLGTVILLTELCVALNRFWAALFREMANANLAAGLAIIDFALYTGYAIPRPSMVKWFKWLTFWNPLAKAYELIMTNEFRSLNVPCYTMVPEGGVYDMVPDAYRACASPGVPPGVNTANGSAYLQLVYDCEWSPISKGVANRWTLDVGLSVSWGRRWVLAGTLLGMWLGLVIAYAVACEFQTDPSTSTGVLLLARKNSSSQSESQQVEEAASSPSRSTLAPSSGFTGVHAGSRVFTFRDVQYEVPVKGEAPRRILDGITGHIVPGQLTAIMGASGGGKTSLMNVLAQRTKDVGVVTGTFTCDGSPLPLSFSHEMGYCEQMDTHLSTATAREALQFSALLRQSSGSKEDKLAWCEEVINLLDMGSWADALVGTGGDGQGLDAEQRKRLTIGVELAAKPKLLLFLDEPTSGMDSLAAWSIVSFLKRLAASGRSILCTIHQPSGDLLAQFDRLLLLDKGRLVFNGSIHNAERSCGAILDHFESHSSRKCDGSTNPAEFTMDCVASLTAKGEDWAEVYRRSAMAATVDLEVQEVEARKGARALDPGEREREAEYAVGFLTQFTIVLRRAWIHYWRSPAYLGSKIALNLVAGLFIGSSFWQQREKTTIASLQNRLFYQFAGNVMGVPLAQHMLPQYANLREVFETRERGAKCYSWIVFVATFIVVELPWDWLAGALYWLPWVLMGDDTGSLVKSFTWAVLLFYTFWPLMAIWVQNLANNALLGGVLFSSLYTFCVMFSGVTVPPSMMPKFWKFMFTTSPLHYFVEAQMGAALLGQSCTGYLSDFGPSLQNVTEALRTNATPPTPGYWTPLPDGSCGWCKYSRADQFLTTIEMDAAHTTRNLWIFAVHILFNFLSCFLSFYLFRVFSPRSLFSHSLSSAGSR